MHAVSYGSQALTKSQRNSTVSQLELGAIVAALKAYGCFAIHREVTIITDNFHCLAVAFIWSGVLGESGVSSRLASVTMALVPSSEEESLDIPS